MKRIMFTIMFFLSMSFAAYGAPQTTGCNIAMDYLSAKVVNKWCGFVSKTTKKALRCLFLVCCFIIFYYGKS